MLGRATRVKIYGLPVDASRDASAHRRGGRPVRARGDGVTLKPHDVIARPLGSATSIRIGTRPERSIDESAARVPLRLRSYQMMRRARRCAASRDAPPPCACRAGACC